MGRRIGRWRYGNHGPLGCGWRLDDTNLLLDYDRLNGSCSVRGAYTLWTDGQEGAAIDHYLDAAMAYVEEYIEPARADL